MNESFQLFRVAFFRSDFFQNPYFSKVQTLIFYADKLPEAATVFSGDPRVGVPPPPPEMETRRDKDKEASLDLVLYFFGEISSDEEDMSTSSSKNGEVS